MDLIFEKIWPPAGTFLYDFTHTLLRYTAAKLITVIVCLCIYVDL